MANGTDGWNAHVYANERTLCVYHCENCGNTFAMTLLRFNRVLIKDLELIRARDRHRDTEDIFLSTFLLNMAQLIFSSRGSACIF